MRAPVISLMLAVPDARKAAAWYKLGITTTRVEVFCDDPDSLIARAVTMGADGSIDRIRNHEARWGVHRQGGFRDPFGHLWLVGDRSPLDRHA
jgi:uncharacterized glyoxalase superfamily protein PhnB